MRIKNIGTIISFILFLLHISILSGQKINSTQIDSIVQVSMDMMTHVGIAVAVIQDGEVIHSKGYGIASASSGEKVNEKSHFLKGSE